MYPSAFMVQPVNYIEADLIQDVQTSLFGTSHPGRDKLILYNTAVVASMCLVKMALVPPAFSL